MSDRTEWYGEDPAWRYPFERDAKRSFRRSLGGVIEVPANWWAAAPRSDNGCSWNRKGFGTASGDRRLVYTHTGLRVSSRRDPVPIRVEFHETPLYATYGLRPEDYPRVFADPGARSKHRFPSDDALCLYTPEDPRDRRWASGDGLLALLVLVADHLFAEAFWRRSGNWVLPEAPHGLAA